jgi:tRNA pseudouridine13 synthase
LSALPFLSGLGGVGGHIKTAPAHFRVLELADKRETVPASEADCLKDAGKHAYVTLTREGQTTRDVLAVLARVFSVQQDQIGYAGLKDRHAICTQTFSLPRDDLRRQYRSGNALTAIGERCTEAGFRLECEPSWQRCKLRKGQLRGNHFEIIVSDTHLSPSEAASRARDIAHELRRVGGWANFFGPQRFGRGGSDAALARSRDVLAGRVDGGRAGRRRVAQWLDTLQLNSLQSALFNEVVTRRIQAGMFSSLWAGDLVCPPDSAAKPRTVMPAGVDAATNEGNFDPAAAVSEGDAAAFAAGGVSFTAPLFGAGMAKARGAAGELELSVWRDFMPDVPLSALKPSVLYGSRRVGRLPVPADLEVEEHPAARGILLRFSLPRGTYATSLLREVMGRECDSPEDAESRDALAAAGESAPQDDQPARALDVPWTAEGVVGLRLSCESVLDEKKCVAQCLALLRELDATSMGDGTDAAPAGNSNSAAAAGTGVAPSASSDAATATDVDAATAEGRGGCVEGGEPAPRNSAAGSCSHRRNSGGGFSLARTGAGGLLLLRCSSADPNLPVSIAVRILEQALARGESPAPLVVRLLPCQAACPANIPDIVRTLQPLLSPLSIAREGECSFCVQLKQRGSSRVDKAEVIKQVGRLVQRTYPSLRVNLERACYAVTIDVFDGTACLALLPHWHRLECYNLRAAAKAGAGLAQGLKGMSPEVMVRARGALLSTE